MVHLTKFLRHGGPTPYHNNPRYMIGCGKELTQGGHYYSLLPVHLVTIGGCVICALYMARCLFFGIDVNLNKESRSHIWLRKPINHQWKFLSFNLKYKDLDYHPNHPGGFNLEKANTLTSRDYFSLLHGKKDEATEAEE